MFGLKLLRSTQIAVLGICFVIATITSTVILSRAFLTFKRMEEEVIDVTGSASKEIKSDYATWSARFSRKDPEMVVAYRKLKEDLRTVREYLISKGVKESEIVVSQVGTDRSYKSDSKGRETSEIEYYIMRQNIEVQSHDVDKVTEISRESTELIEKGIEFISYSPDYFYTKLADLKHEMLSLASEDAKKRADKMATSTGSRIGVMRNARMGVFQITPVNSYEVSGWGRCDTSTLEKKITAVAHVEFAISEAQ